MDDPDYFRTALVDLSEEMARLAEKGAAKFEIGGALSRCEAILMHLADDEHHDWLCREFQQLAERHDVVALCIDGGSRFVRQVQDGAASRAS